MRPGETAWLRRVVRPHARVRLVCLPYAGASSVIYRDWARSLGPDVEVCAVELPGRSLRIREPLERRIEPLVRGLCDAIRELDDKPLALFGYSMGALLGFELARALRRRCGVETRLLMVAACIAPHVGWTHGPPLHAIADDEQFLAELTLRYGPVAPELLAHPDMRQLVIAVMRADLEVLETYVHHSEPALACPVVAFGGDSDHATPREALRAWRLHGSGRFEMTMFRGDHFFLRSAVVSLHAEVRRQLAGVAEPPGLPRSQETELP